MSISSKLEAAINNQADDYPCWHVFDLETGRAPQDVIQAKIAEFEPKTFEPKELSLGKLTDEAKIAAKKAEFELKEVERLKEFELSEQARYAKYCSDVINKSSLTDDAPIICLSFETGNGDNDKAVFSCMPKIEIKEPIINGFELLQFDTEKAMLKQYAEYLQTEYEQTNGDFVLSGFNILGFDLPLTRVRMVRNELKVPPVFLPRQPKIRVYDQMKYAPDFSLEVRKHAERNGWFVSFDMLARALQISTHKSEVTGAQIPIMHKEALDFVNSGNPEKAQELIHAILVYSALDAQKETKAFKIMNGIN